MQVHSFDSAKNDKDNKGLPRLDIATWESQVIQALLK